jgi:hypothetical protein
LGERTWKKNLEERTWKKELGRKNLEERTWKRELRRQVGSEKVDLDVFSYRIWDRLELRGDIEGFTSQLGVALNSFSTWLLFSPTQWFSSTRLLLNKASPQMAKMKTEGEMPTIR